MYRDEIIAFQNNKNIGNTNHPLLFILFMNIPKHLGEKDIIRGGVIINMIFGVAIVLLLIKICYNILRSPKAMVYAGLLASSNSNLIYYSTQLLRENSYLFFVCLAIELLTRNKKESLIKTLLLSIITACAFFCRIEGLEIIIIYTGIRAITFLLDKNKNSRKIRRLAIYYAIYLCGIITVCFVVNLLCYGTIQLDRFATNIHILDFGKKAIEHYK